MRKFFPTHLLKRIFSACLLFLGVLLGPGPGGLSPNETLAKELKSSEPTADRTSIADGGFQEMAQRKGKGRKGRKADQDFGSGTFEFRITPNLYFVDAHSQMDNNVDEERVISLMDHAGIYRTNLSHHLLRTFSSLLDFGKQNPERINPAVRTKGRDTPYPSNVPLQMKQKGFGAMAEVMLFHGSGGGEYKEVRVNFDDSLVREAFEAARSKGWPFIIHIEFASLSGDARQQYMEMLEKFVIKYRDYPFVMIHMAQLEAEPVRRLLAAHSNLHFMTSHSSPPYQKGSKPFINMFNDMSLKREWKQLIADYPDRFVFAMDNVFSKNWVPSGYLKKMTLWWRALGELPDELAHAVAHGNAERLWKLAPKPDGVEVAQPWNSKEKLGPVTGYSAGTKNR